LVYRSIDHRALRVLCEDVGKPTLPAKYAKYAPGGGFGPDLKAFAAAIIDLQEKRHLADYDPQFRVRASDAVVVVTAARDALTRFRSASRPQRRALMTLLLFSPR
jgi:hypothetical protein